MYMYAKEIKIWPTGVVTVKVDILHENNNKDLLFSAGLM